MRAGAHADAIIYALNRLVRLGVRGVATRDWACIRHALAALRLESFIALARVRTDLDAILIWTPKGRRTSTVSLYPTASRRRPRQRRSIPIRLGNGIDRATSRGSVTGAKAVCDQVLLTSRNAVFPIRRILSDVVGTRSSTRRAKTDLGGTRRPAVPGDVSLTRNKAVGENSRRAAKRTKRQNQSRKSCHSAPNHGHGGTSSSSNGRGVEAVSASSAGSEEGSAGQGQLCDLLIHENFLPKVDEGAGY